MKVYLVVLNWNGNDFIEDCLDSLQKQIQPAEVIVVDNGSTDGSAELIERKYPKIHLLKQNKNHGFAGGVNIGIKYAIKNGANAVALFNNDATADKDWLKYLVTAMEKNEEAGIVTSKLMRDDKKHFDSTGDFYTIWGIPGPRGRNRLDKGQYDKAESVFAASGGASLYRTRMLKETGLFDERFFAYIEDVDISFRARLLGWDIWYEPKAIAYHKISASSSKMAKGFNRYHWAKNFNIIYTKNMPGFLYWKYLPLFLSQLGRYALSSMARGEYWSFLKGKLVFLFLLPGVLRDRKKIQSKRRLTNKQVDKLLVHSRPPRIPRISGN